MIGLVDDHQARTGGKHLFHGGTFNKITGGVVGIGDKYQRGLLRPDRRKHRIRVQRKIRAQRHTEKGAADETRNLLIHHKARTGRQYRPSGGS